MVSSEWIRLILEEKLSAAECAKKLPRSQEKASRKKPLAEFTRVAIVAALPREVRPLVRNWPCSRQQFEGHEFEFFEKDGVVLVCGGIGGERARRATEAVIQLYDPELVVSAGFAGALQRDVVVGQVLMPRIVIDAGDSSRTNTQDGTGILVTFSSVADADQKGKLAKAFDAQAVDMEAAAVAKSAEKHGLRFTACKAISDASNFFMPALGLFIREGKFQTRKFATHVMLRPWLWKSAVKLARDSALAARNLCQSLATLADRPADRPIKMQATSSVKT